MEPIFRYTISLIRYVLKGDKPDFTGKVDFEKLYAFSAFHGVENMLYVALRDLKADVPKDTMKKFKTAYERAMMIEAVQALELEAISNAFETAGICHIPLKGSVIKYLYPDPSYRKSGDIDILIKPDDKKRVHKIMHENGYLVDKADEYELHEGYRKPPFILTEIHDRLVEKNNRAYAFLSNVWENVKPMPGTRHRYEMTDEMLYVFSVAHFAKHIKNGGAGIKFVSDMYVLSKKEIDKNTVGEMLEKSRLSEFDSILSQLTDSWFGNCEDVSPSAERLEDFVLCGGSFGTEEQKKLIKTSSAAATQGQRIKYRIKRVFKGFFPDYISLKKQYPWLERSILLFPIAWLVRCFSLLTVRRYKIKNELSIDTKKSKELEEIWKTVK